MTRGFPDIELDARICRKLGKRPGQSIQERCEEIMANAHRVGSGITIGQRWIARTLLDALSDREGVWDAMRRADNLPVFDPGTTS